MPRAPSSRLRLILLRRPGQQLLVEQADADQHRAKPDEGSARSTPSSSDMSKMKTFATATAISDRRGDAQHLRLHAQTPATSSATPMASHSAE